MWAAAVGSRGDHQATESKHTEAIDATGAIGRRRSSSDPRLAERTMGTAAVAVAAAAAAAVLAAVAGSAANTFTYRSLMEKGASLCEDSPYYSEDDVDKIARYCLLVTEEQDCLQYCIYKKLGMQKKEHWDKNTTTTLLVPLLMKEFYAPNTKEKDIRLDIKYCIEKSMLPPEAELIPTDYCEVAEYVHFCMREHFPEDKKEDCYPD